MHRFYLSRVFKLICIVHLLIMNSLLAVPGELINGEIKPVRVSTPPQIDGSLNDEAWQHSPIHEPFLTYNPSHGKHLPQETFVFLAYDDNNLFFAFRCLDTEPEKIKTSITQRDHMFSDDWVGLSLDGLGNRQSASRADPW